MNTAQSGGKQAQRREERREQLKKPSMHARVQKTDIVSRHEWCIYAGWRAILRLVLLGQERQVGRGW